MLCQCNKRHIVLESVEPKWLVESLMDQYWKEGTHAVIDRRKLKSSK